MLEHLHDAVVPVTSANGKNLPSFGTGFVIYRDDTGTYLLTCAHVVNDAGKGQIYIGGELAEIILMGEPDGFDIALLRVGNPAFLTHVQPLRLGLSRNSTHKVGLIGIAPYAQYKERSEIRGELSHPSSILNAKGTATTRAWEITPEYGDILNGYSGSPVIDLVQNVVVGIAITREGKVSGKIISIEALAQLHTDLPPWIDEILRNHQDRSSDRGIFPQREHRQGKMQQRRMELKEGKLKKEYRNIRKSLDLVDFDLIEQMNSFRSGLGQYGHGFFCFTVGGVDYGRVRDHIVPRMVKVIKETTACDLIPRERWILPRTIQNVSDIEFLVHQWLNEDCIHHRDLFDQERTEGFLTIYNQQLPISQLQPIAVHIADIMRAQLATVVEAEKCLLIVLWVNLYAEAFEKFPLIPHPITLPANYAPIWLNDRLKMANVDREDTKHCLTHLIEKIEQTGGNVNVIYQTLEKIALALEKGNIRCLS